jgi:hypothetical protein
MKRSAKFSIRWLAIEVMGPPPKLITEGCDVWAWGVTVWEMFK